MVWVYGLKSGPVAQPSRYFKQGDIREACFVLKGLSIKFVTHSKLSKSFYH